MKKEKLIKIPDLLDPNNTYAIHKSVFVRSIVISWLLMNYCGSLLHLTVNKIIPPNKTLASEFMSNKIKHRLDEERYYRNIKRQYFWVEKEK